jgi:phosphatidylglycerol---prolipoprotein diacylglyceryl transferase
MLQTLFTIPREIAGIPVFGFGWVLAIWAVASLALVTWSYLRHGWQEARGYLVFLGVFGFVMAFVVPRAFSEGLPIRGYGVMLLLAVLASVMLGLYRARQVGLDPEIILSLGTRFFISGFLGARLFYIIEYWDRFWRPTLSLT